MPGFKKCSFCSHAISAADGHADCVFCVWNKHPIQSESTVVDIIDDEVYLSQSLDVESQIQAAVPLPEPVSDDEDLGNTEQENEYISDKHPDETVTIELENTETYIYEPQKTDEKASKTEAHQEQPSDI